MAVAVVAALLQWVRRRSELDKAIFDAGNLVLAAGAAGLTFHALDGSRGSSPPRLPAACTPR